MKSEFHASPNPPAPPPRAPASVRTATMRFTSTRRGAHLARHSALRQLAAWGVPYGCEASDTVELLVGELSANAAVHGRVPGRDFQVRLVLTPGPAHKVLRIEVADTRGERRPDRSRPIKAPDAEAESGRGLLLVEALATRWGVAPRLPVGKTVWCEVALPVRAFGLDM
jgi:anti-sigma regulatory factor (Ser/Thr protein kinase)